MFIGSASRYLRISLKIAGVVFALLGAYALLIWLRLPNVNNLRTENPVTTSYMRHRASQLGLLENAYQSQWITLSAISPLFVCSVLNSEDMGFFWHQGLLWQRISDASTAALFGARHPGSSTITQQVARNIYLHPERTIDRKIQEILITKRIERALSKRRILELYLNIVELGDGIWGVQHASHAYFDKSAKELELFESVFLTSLIPSPRIPYPRANDRAWELQKRILYQLYKSGLIDARSWRRGLTQANLLHQAITEGRPLSEALHSPMGSVMDIPDPIRFDRSALPLDRAVELHCGLDRVFREMQQLRKSRSEQTTNEGH